MVLGSRLSSVWLVSDLLEFDLLMMLSCLFGVSVSDRLCMVLVMLLLCLWKLIFSLLIL